MITQHHSPLLVNKDTLSASTRARRTMSPARSGTPHGKIEPRAVIKSRKGLSGVEGRKGICYQWKEKGQCSQGDRCSVRHESNDHAQNPEPKAATPSEPSMSRGRSVSRKRSIRGKSNHGAILRQPSRFFLKGNCTPSSCEYWHPPECQFFETETGCKAGISVCSCIISCTNNQTKSQRKATSPTKEGKATTRMVWLL